MTSLYLYLIVSGANTPSTDDDRSTALKKFVTVCSPVEPKRKRFLAGLLIPTGIDRYPQLKSVLPCPNTLVTPELSLTIMNVKMSLLDVAIGGEPPDH